MAEVHTGEEYTAVHGRRRGGKRRQVSDLTLVVGFIVVALLGYAAGALNGQLGGGGLRGLLGQKELDLSSVQETYQAVAANFDGTVDQQKLIEGANKGLVNALGDQYTVFMNQQESTEFDDSLSGNIGGGIGVELALRNNVPTVVRVLQNNPAEKAGIQVNDIIVKVNGDDASTLSINDVVTKIRGEAGTTVKLTINRAGEQQEFSVTRETVNNPSAYGEVKDGIGILTITRFDDNTSGLARQVAQDFKNQNVKGVVLDLRGNGGGFVTAAQNVAGLWLKNEVVVTERRSGKVTEELKSGSDPILSGVPTVVLVNQSSASASEIVAGALHDHKVATLVGTTTFGKGSVQKLMNLSDGATLKVTVARWYTPSGVNISETGIAPDKTVQRTADDMNAGRDPQLDAALSSL